MQLNDRFIDKLVPLITVVIPTYNRLPFIIEAVNSVIAQTYTDWELFIVDDGSTDGTIEAIKKISDSRIKLIELKHEGHIGKVIDIGINHSSAEWITFLGSDDIWLPEKLEIQLNALQKTGKRWCYGGFELMDEAQGAIPVKTGKYRPISGKIIRQLLTTEAGITICSVMVERQLLEEVGGFQTHPQLIFRGDYELTLRLALNAEVIAVPDLLVRVREYSGRITHTLFNPHEWSALPYKFFINLKPGKELEKIARRRHAYHMSEAAKKNLKYGKYLKAFTQLNKAIIQGDKFRHVLSSLYRGIQGHLKNVNSKILF